MTTTETKEALGAIINNIEDGDITEILKLKTRSLGIELSKHVKAVPYSVSDGDLSILESSDSEKFLGTIYSDHENAKVHTLTVVGTYTKTHNLLFSLFIDHHSIIEKAKKVARDRFTEIFPKVCDWLGGGLLRPYSESAEAPSPLIIQQFSRFFGIPYKVTYHAVVWKSRAILSI